MLHLHSVLRWVILFFVILTIIKSYKGMKSGREFLPADKKPSLFFMIFMDIQLLIGLYLYFLGNLGFKLIESEGMGGVMKNTYSRFYAIEHIFGMVVAIIFAHLAYAVTKKDIDSKVKYKKIFTYSVIALVIMLITIPWPFRTPVNRPLFPGM